MPFLCEMKYVMQFQFDLPGENGEEKVPGVLAWLVQTASVWLVDDNFFMM